MKFVQLKALRDIVMLVASSPASNVIQHYDTGDAHLYFIVGGTLKEVFMYVVKEKEALEGNFVTYNGYSGEIGASDKIMHEPNMSSFPIVEIVNQDFLPPELIEKLNHL